MKKHAIIAGVSFTLAWLVVGLVLFPDTGPAPDVTVPGVVGLRFEEAERKLAETGLKAVLGETQPSLTAPRRYVLAQTPAAGTTVGSGLSVTLDVSAGQVRARVPTLVGLTRNDAVAAIRGANLELGQVVEKPGPERPSNSSSVPDRRSCGCLT
jgi:beta-lactam-binding protein with PASTA domain